MYDLKMMEEVANNIGGLENDRRENDHVTWQKIMCTTLYTG